MAETSVLSHVGSGLFGMRLGDQPHYEVITSEGPIEIRYYDPQTLISITLQDNNHDNEDDEAFVALEKYIYGQNSSSLPIAHNAHTASSTKDETMTSYFMTAPLFHSKKSGSPTISFVLPLQYSLSTAPQPLDSRIYLHEKPGHLRAVIKYSSDIFDQNEGEKEAQTLLEWIKNHSLYVQIGEFQTAQYDTTGLRRNEIHLEISELH